MVNRREKVEAVADFFFFFGWGGPKLLQMVTATMKLDAPWKKRYDKPSQHVKKQRHHFADKSPRVKAVVFPLVMYR